MRIIIPKKDIKEEERVTISGEKAHYLISVLRCEIGDSLQVSDGGGSFFNARISEIHNKRVTIYLLEKVSCDTESPLNLILIQGILKGEKMDMVIQKTTELGVKEIIPAITEKSQVRYTRKVERWRKIAEEASRQSGRTVIPVVHAAVGFYDIFGSNPPSPPFSKGGMGGLKDSKSLNGLIFYEEGGLPLKEAIRQLLVVGSQLSVKEQSAKNYSPSTIHYPLFVAIGSEGGFTKEEVIRANLSGLITVSLGKRILRAETAAISAMALIQFLIGDIE